MGGFTRIVRFWAVFYVRREVLAVYAREKADGSADVDSAVLVRAPEEGRLQAGVCDVQ